MLFILLLEVAKLAVQLIQRVLQVLNLLHGVRYFVAGTCYRVLLLLQQIRNGGNAVVVVLLFSVQHVKSLLLRVDVLVEVEGNVAQPS